MEIIEDREFIEKARSLCGYYILQTTEMEIEDKEVECYYKGLKHVEESFKELKDVVEIRPVFHWKDRRVKTQVFLCIMAQAVVNKLKRVLKESGWPEAEDSPTLKSFIDTLGEIQLGIFDIEKAEKEIITELTDEHKRLLRIFGIDERYFVKFKEAKKVFSLH